MNYRYSSLSGERTPRFLNADDIGMVELSARIDPGNGWELPQPGDSNAAQQIVRIGRSYEQMRGLLLARLPEEREK